MAVQPETLKFGPQWIRELSDGAFNYRRHLSKSPTKDNMTMRTPNPITSSQKHASDIGGTAPNNRLKDLVTDQCRSSLWEEEYSGAVMSSKPIETPITGQSFSSDYNKEYSQCLMTTRTDLQIKYPGQKIRPHNVPDAWHHKTPVLPDSKWQLPSTALDSVSANNFQLPGSNQLNVLDSTTQSKNSFTTAPSGGSLFSSSRSCVEGIDLKANTSLLNFEAASSVNLRASVQPSGINGSHKRAVSAYYGITDQDKLPIRSAVCQNSFNVISQEERGLHQPDGADQPDEHMWLYEDPQGRTQGTFSDAQMHEWLLAGIYFTPSLRIRRKCDDTLSSLANYTQLFGRVPFLPGPRIAPIRGGITTNVLTNLVQNKLNCKDNMNDCIGSDLLSTNTSLCTNSNNSSVVNTNLFVGGGPVTKNGPVQPPPPPQQHQSSVFPDTQYPILHHCTEKLDVHNTTNKSGVPNSSIFNCSLEDDKLVNANRSQAQSHLLSSTSPSLSTLINGLNLVAKSELEFDAISSANTVTTAATTSVMDNSQSGNQCISSSALFASLASFISMNPITTTPGTVSSSAGSSVTQSIGGGGVAQAQTANIMNGDSAALLSPAFLSALTQYLNVQSPSTNQTSSPMQQLAETAQLAAQLAALVGAHSPDQTPMQPAQALALAQFLITRGVGVGRKDNDSNSSTGIENGTPTASLRKDDNFHGDANSVVNVIGNQLINSNVDRRLDAQSQWPSLSASTSSHLSPRSANDGRYNLMNKRLNESAQTSAYAHNSNANLSDSGGHVIQTQNTTSYRGASTTKSQMVASSRIHPPANYHHQSQHHHHQPQQSNARQITSRSLQSDSGLVTVTTNNNNHFYDGVGSSRSWTNTNRIITQSNSNNNNNSDEQRRLEHGLSVVITANYNNTSTSGQYLNKSSKSTNLGKSPVKPNNNGNDVSVSTPTSNVTQSQTNKSNKSNPAQEIHNHNNSTTTNAISTAIGGNNNSSGTSTTLTTLAVSTTTNPNEIVEEEELEKLTQWCQYRLSKLPMREKVDIPTVVELLATLDAPYEVERMVHTFLGETARTTQFVKEFLDRRRPFWQLHRERRDGQTNTAQTTNQNSNQISNSSRSSTDKKKRHPAGGDTTTTSSLQRHNIVNCNGLNNAHVSGTEQLQDNQWHHIKSKGSHSRKSKKDKSA